MDVKINIATSGDVIFEGALLFAPTSNYGDGEGRGERPAIRWAMIRLPDIIMRSGLFNIKGLDPEDTAEEAATAARNALFGNMCPGIVDAVLEEYEREGS